VTSWDGAALLTTSRLRLRTFRLEDLPLYAELNSDPEVVQFLGGVPLTSQDSDETAQWAQDLHAREGIGLLAVERRGDGRFLGMCGLHHLDEWFPDDIEIAWRLAREHWGQGYATEAAAAWLDHAFGALALPRVISVSDRSNARSVAVMQRLGMVFDHDAELEDEGVRFEAVVYSLAADHWRSHRSRTD
jgi:RimJ/RimL family protein N-acetyltransferase